MDDNFVDNFTLRSVHAKKTVLKGGPSGALDLLVVSSVAVVLVSTQTNSRSTAPATFTNLEVP
eukprot:3076107-Karenia_brevis.AAC.1